MGQYQKQIKEHAFKKIQRDIKKDDLGNPLLLFGEEQYLIKWAIGEIISRYVEPAVMQLNCTIYNWESSDIE
ncbi:MAG TPA: hypothetical protein VFC96_02065, partial [Anaerovoracaceae bacterium]|nr:hypothetical protein [Anaerovoracaceae bacterium]